MVALEPVRLIVAFQDEEEGLSEAKEHDAVDDGEGEHVPGDHLEDHGDKGPGELDGPTEEHEVEPGSGHGKDEESFLYRPTHLFLFPKLGGGNYITGFDL